MLLDAFNLLDPEPLKPYVAASEETFKEAVKAIIVATLPELPSGAIVWVDEAKPFFAPTNKTIVNLDLIATRSIGRDETRQSNHPSLNQVVFTQVGQRVSRVSIQPECLSHDGSRWSFRWAEQIRNRIRWESIHNLLLEYNIAVVTVGESKKLPNYTIDERTYSKANIDIDFAWVLYETQTDYDGGWIEVVEVVSPFEDYVNNPIVIDKNEAP